MISNKHAYLIIAHTDSYCLDILINMIDDDRNDIFLLIDSKSKLQGDKILVHHSNLYLLPKIDIRWGDYSQIQAELNLIEYAVNTGLYNYFHLLSGQDLPIKTQDYIHNFFNNLPIKYNFVGFSTEPNLDYNIKERTNYYTFFTKYYRESNQLKRKFFSILRNSIIKLQKNCNFARSFDGIKLYKGCNWFSITLEAAKFLVSQKQLINKYFSHTHAPDELFLQSILRNNIQFAETFYDLNSEFNGCLREIDWRRGSPYVWERDDFQQLINSHRLFARKFSSSTDREIIDLIFEYVNQDACKK